MKCYRLDKQIDIFKSVLSDMCQNFPVDTLNIEVKAMLEFIGLTRGFDGIINDDGLKRVKLENIHIGGFLYVDLGQILRYLSQLKKIEVDNRMNKYKIPYDSVGWLPREYLNMLKLNIDKSFAITSKQFAKELRIPFKELIPKNTRWKHLGDESLDISKNRKHFKLKGKEYTFARNSTNPSLIIESLLKNREHGLIYVHQALKKKGTDGARRDYNQFINTILKCTNGDFAKSELEIIFRFDQPSKTISFKNPLSNLES